MLGIVCTAQLHRDQHIDPSTNYMAISSLQPGLLSDLVQQPLSEIVLRMRYRDIAWPRGVLVPRVGGIPADIA
jgi:hypothetical protein